jgi:hypothetical protein
MKTISRTYYALAVCAAAAILGSCGGAAAQFPNPASYTTALVVGPSSSGDEDLIGTAMVMIYGGGCGHFPGARATFSASGTATGSHPGTFTANGNWGTEGVAPFQSYFGESFAIYESSGKTITGTVGVHYHNADTISSGERESSSGCGFSARGYYRTTGHKHRRKAQIMAIQNGDFSETLDDL